MDGGHLFFSVGQQGTEITASVYDPTGLSAVASLLEPCDKIEIGCGIRKGTSKHLKVLNIEYLSVVKLAEVFDTANPLCPNCGKRMKSAGVGKGFKCPRCRFKDPQGAKIHVTRSRDLRPGLYLPAIKAHRHLSKPLQRYGREKLCNNVDLSQDGLLHVCTNACAHEKSSGYTSEKDDGQPQWQTGADSACQT
jgi:tRNA(Ile2)-agmatinylcytidine synthase